MAQGADLGALLQVGLTVLGLTGRAVSCRCTDDAELRQLNRTFAGEDRATDVLAFPAADSRDPRFRAGPGASAQLGDIAISVERAALQAQAAGVAPADELRLLAAHGLCHLAGHGHDAAAAAGRMTEATREILAADAAARGVPAPVVPALVAPGDGPA